MKNPRYFLLVFIFIPLFTFAQNNTDIYLMDISYTNDSMVFSNINNITSSNEGYDNQPYFVNGSDNILFSSIRDENQSDIYNYNSKTKQISQITSTVTSEFSPTPIKNKGIFTTVRVEEDGIQRIWQINKRSKKEKLILSKVKGIGYHSWISKNNLALFIVGQPHELHIANKKTNSSAKIASNIGSAIHKWDNYNVAYMDFTDSSDCKIKTYNLQSKKSEVVCNCIKDSEYFVLMNNNDILSGIGKKLYRYRFLEDKWELVADFSNIKEMNLYRIAINKKENKLALVSRN